MAAHLATWIPLSARWLLLAASLAVPVLTPTVAQSQEWHESYADGQRALKNGQPDRAVTLFKRAIQRRPAPGVSVPTYGTNFEPKYFPYLRLAEAYLRLEAYEEALTTLETSTRFGTEPADERKDLETRARTALAARQQALKPEPAATPPPVPAPVVIESTKVSPPAPPPPPPPADAVQAAPPTATSPRTADASRGAVALEVTSDPVGAQVFVDDELIGRTDAQTGRLRLTTLKPGRHRVRLSLEGHQDVAREVVLTGKPVSVSGVLTPQTPSTETGGTVSVVPEPAPPRRWPAIGAALVLAAAGVGLLIRRGRRVPTPERHTAAPSASVSGSHENLPLQFGEYLLVRRIGRGGMATVYEAERRGERFALKRPLAGFLDDARFLERFVREADLGRTLHHPNIVRIFERGEVDGIPFFTMELIEGETLRDRLDREGRIDPAVATMVTARVAEALDYAHHKGIIHRDLKPSNIMIDRTGAVKVMDYGIARAQHLAGVTTTGGFIGTPHYAAPEAAEAMSEPRSDVYSLGIVFFEMLTGNPPFRGDNAFAVIHSHCVTPPPAPSSLNYAIPKALDRIVLHLLSKQAEARPTAEELLNELNDYLRQDR